MFDDETPRALDAVLTLCEMTLLSDADGETVEALRALLVERASKDGV